VVRGWLARHDCHAALVRPDHYVFGVARDAAGLDALLGQWRRHMGRVALAAAD